MTTPPVVSITDELIAELEKCERDGLAAWINAADVSALLAERAELKQQLAEAFGMKVSEFIRLGE